MLINKEQNGSIMTIAIEGRLDTSTAPQLHKEIKELEGISGIIFDFEKLVYISSAGLRVLMMAHKGKTAADGIKIINVNDDVKEIFEITGFDTIFDVE